MTQLIKTHVYLDPTTRAKLERYAAANRITISHAMRVFAEERLDGGVRLEDGLWFKLAIGALLRYHAEGDLERVVREGIALAKANGHG